jgi:hypothetical protein
MRVISHEEFEKEELHMIAAVGQVCERIYSESFA